MKLSTLELDHFREKDDAILRLSQNIKVLSRISWPASAQEAFLTTWRAGNPSYPEVHYQVTDMSELIQQLEDLYHSIDTSHPIGMYLFRTAESYYYAAQMLQHMNTSMFTTYSKILYGEPSSDLAGSAQTHLKAAKHFIEIADDFHFDANFYKAMVYYSSSELKVYLESEIKKVISDDDIRIELDAELPAKAAAGAKRIRIRANTLFSEYEAAQLLHHEVFTHSLTAINGRDQPIVRSFGLGAPRTTPSQEGLATFSELITGSIDLLRLKRISLRIEAVDKALSGADFLDVFRFLVEQGEADTEAYNSAMRIFRGGTARGGVVFTKDCSYLTGLLSVHTFFRKALKDNCLDEAEILFAGRLTIDDAEALYPFVREGILAKPKYIPHWFRNFHSLAANLAFSLFANHIDVRKVD